MIPRVLFTSFKPELKDCELSDNIVSEWKDRNPDFEILYFSDAGMERFFESNPLGREAYGILKNGTAKADLFRICYIYRHGGTWFDFDLESFAYFGHFEKNILENGAVLYDYGCKNISYMLISGEKGSELFRGAIEHISNKVIANRETIEESCKHPGMDMCGPHAFQEYVNAGDGKFPAPLYGKIFTSGSGKPFFYIKAPPTRKVRRHYDKVLKNNNAVKWTKL